MNETYLDYVAHISVIDKGLLGKQAMHLVRQREEIWQVYLGRLCREYHLINDHYDIELSIKDSEQKNEALYALAGKKYLFLSPIRKFNGFFANVGNKIRLQEFLFGKFQNLAELYQKTIFYSLKQRRFSLNPLSCSGIFLLSA